MEDVIGSSHPLARRIRKLRQDREARDREGVILAEGVHLAEEALASRVDIDCALVSPRLATVEGGPDLLRRLGQAGASVHETSDAVLDSLEDARSPQPVLLVVRRRRLRADEVLASAEGAPWIVVAVGIQDPGNLGSLLRTADAAGATGLIAAGPCADLHHPRTARATMGSIFRLPAAHDEAGPLLDRLRDRGIRRVGADLGAQVPYDRFDWRGPLSIWLGSEGRGLPREVLESMDARVGIPMREGVESLSVGAAAAVLLYEARRKRGQSPFSSRRGRDVTS